LNATPQPDVRTAPPFRAALVLSALAVSWAGTSSPASAGAPPVELAETKPVETTLGNLALRPAREIWLEMIAGAATSLDLEHFYLSHWPNEALAPVLDAIGAAAKRGVRVRLLLDRGMHATYPLPADSLGTVPGIEVRLVDFDAIAGGVQHAKMILVDGRETFLGSQNLDWRALKHIHELGVRVSDERLARALGGVFDMDWAAADTGATPAARDEAVATARERACAAAADSPFAIERAPGDTVRVAPAWSPLPFIPDSTHWDRDRILALLDGAHDDVAIQLLNYGVESGGHREPSVDDALRRAAARGVRVRLLVSDWEAGTGGMPALQSLARVPGTEVRMLTIPEWSGGYIPFARVQHCKFLAVDGEAVWIGTSNWSPGYWLTSRNVSVTLWSRSLVLDVMRTFERSWGDPGAAPLDPDRSYPAKIRGATPPPGRAVYGG
jgi:phosphatidylserine/phosphatidylglycerophosphate/cardiolipin synthase-like enzyme